MLYEIIKNNKIYYLKSVNGVVTDSEVKYWEGYEFIDVLFTCMVFNYSIKLIK